MKYEIKEFVDLKTTLRRGFSYIFALVVTGFFAGEIYTRQYMHFPDNSGPSSTAGLDVFGYLIIPGIIWFAWFMGQSFGEFIEDKLTNKFEISNFIQRVQHTKILSCLLLVAICLSILSAYISHARVISHLECDRLKIFYTNNVITDKNFDGNSKDLLEINSNIKTLMPNDITSLAFSNKFTANVGSGRVVLYDQNHSEISDKRLGCSYIINVQGTEVKFSKTESTYIVIMARLRATSHRSWLLIYSPEGKLVFEEKLRTGAIETKLYKYKEPDEEVESLVVASKQYFIKN